MSALEEDSELEMDPERFPWDCPAQQMWVPAFRPYEQANLLFWPIFETTIIIVSLLISFGRGLVALISKRLQDWILELECRMEATRKDL